MEEIRKMEFQDFRDGFFNNTKMPYDKFPEQFIQYVQARTLLNIANLMIDIRNDLKDKERK